MSALNDPNWAWKPHRCPDIPTVRALARGYAKLLRGRAKYGDLTILDTPREFATREALRDLFIGEDLTA